MEKVALLVILSAALGIRCSYTNTPLWKFVGLLVAAGFGYGQQLRNSLLHEIAKMMQDPVRSCESGCCVQIERTDGDTQRRLLEIDQSVPSPKNSCHLYVCKVRIIYVCIAPHWILLLVARSLPKQESGLSLVIVHQCNNVPCNPGSTSVLFPGNCCPKCGEYNII